jgi:hypothetical protein
MLELLRDGVWQAIGAGFSVAAIIASFAIYRWQRLKPAFTYLVKSAYPLLKTTEELHGRLSVQVDGVVARNIDVMFIEFQNSGNCSIARTDFDVPVAIAFKPPVRIISAVVDIESPKNLGVNLEVDEQQVTLTPILLNPGDKFTLKLLLSSDSLKYAISGRIMGIKQISETKPSYLLVWLSLLGVFLTTLGSFSTGAKLAESSLRSEQVLSTGLFFALGMTFVGFTVLIYGLHARDRILLKIFHTSINQIRANL